MLPCTATRRNRPDQRGQFLVASSFRGLRRGTQRGGVSPWHPQRSQGAGVAHHHAAHQVAQFVAIGRLARLAWYHVRGAEFFLCLENTGLE
jgi:hypothetical protein